MIGAGFAKIMRMNGNHTESHTITEIDGGSEMPLDIPSSQEIIPNPKEDSSYNNNIRRWFHLLTISLFGLIYGLSGLTCQAIIFPLTVATMVIIGLDLLRIQMNYMTLCVDLVMRLLILFWMRFRKFLPF